MPVRHAPHTETAPPAGYLLAYFTGEQGPDDERTRIAVSAGPSLREWRPLAEPLLPPDLPSRGCRDPFILFDPVPDRLIVLATDARTWPAHDWDSLVTEGRRTIWVWSAEIRDRLEWSAAQSVELGIETAGNAWAPKAWWDSDAQIWRVTFSSALYPAGPRNADKSYQRVFESSTRDFHEFTPARTVLDAGYDVIDLVMIDTPQGAVRLTVPHPDRAEPTAIRIDRVQSPGDRTPTLLCARAGDGLVGATEGPSIATRAESPGYYLIVDEFAGRGCLVLEADEIGEEWKLAETAQLPERARHGSLVALDRALHERLLRASS